MPIAVLAISATAAAAALLTSLPVALACRIANFDSGECTELTDELLGMPYEASTGTDALVMPYLCGISTANPGFEAYTNPVFYTGIGAPNYVACLPKTSQLVPGHTTRAKDQWLYSRFVTMVEERIHWERDEGLKEAALIWVKDDTMTNNEGTEVQVLKTETGAITRRFWNGEGEDPRGGSGKTRPLAENPPEPGQREWRTLHQDDLLDPEAPIRSHVHEAPGWSVQNAALCFASSFMTCVAGSYIYLTPLRTMDHQDTTSLIPGSQQKQDRLGHHRLKWVT